MHSTRSLKKLAPKHSLEHEAMGSPWRVTIWDDLSSATIRSLERKIQSYLDSFDATYSRFSNTSFIAQLARTHGEMSVPAECVTMLRTYVDMCELTNGLFNPLIGQTLSDMGYDQSYSLKPKEKIMQPPHLPDVINIIDDTTIHLSRPVVIDLGAIGKGFAVDALYQILYDAGLETYTVDGSGDMRHIGAHPMTVGLEHPKDTTKVIGTASLHNASMASSSSNRRRWATYHHIINPRTRRSPKIIEATWVCHVEATLADALATALFLVPPEVLLEKYIFEYVILNQDMKVKKSSGWDVQLFTT